eukprot:5538760-Pyramimonas_sp.AAC.1
MERRWKAMDLAPGILGKLLSPWRLPRPRCPGDLGGLEGLVDEHGERMDLRLRLRVDRWRGLDWGCSLLSLIHISEPTRPEPI